MQKFKVEKRKPQVELKLSPSADIKPRYCPGGRGPFVAPPPFPFRSAPRRDWDARLTVHYAPNLDEELAASWHHDDRRAHLDRRHSRIPAPHAEIRGRVQRSNRPHARRTNRRQRAG